MFENNYIYNDDIENTSNVIWQKAKELLDEILTEAQQVGASQISIEITKYLRNPCIYLQIEDYKKEYKQIEMDEYTDLITYIKRFATFDDDNTEEQTGSRNIPIRGNNMSFRIKSSTTDEAKNEFLIILNTEEPDDINNDDCMFYLNKINDEPSNFNLRCISDFISTSFVDLQKLNAKVESSKAKQSVIKKRAVEALQIADEAKENASYFIKPTFGKKKEAIESLQEATTSIAEVVKKSADVQIQMAQSQKDALEIQKINIDHQKRLTAISKGLLVLGSYNITANRTIVRELEMRLRGASEEEIGDLARHELESVLRQLNEQQDILRRIENLEKGSKKIIDNISLSVKRLDSLEEELRQVNTSISNAEIKTQDISEHVTKLEEDYNDSCEKLNSSIVRLDSLEEELQQVNGNISNVETKTQDISEHVTTIEEEQNVLFNLINQKSDDQLILINKLREECDDILNKKRRLYWIPTIISLLALGISIVNVFII